MTPDTDLSIPATLLSPMRQWWEVTVGVYLEGGRIRWISNTEDAAQALLSSWPAGSERHRPKYAAARLVCLQALSGKTTPERARTTFLDAAKEAGIYIEGGPRIRVNNAE